jgi:hypothetical protein
MRHNPNRPRRPALREILREEIRQTYDRILTDYPDNRGNRTQALACAIIRNYLGDGWLEKYVDHTSRRASYLRFDPSSSMPEKGRALMRYWEFAESLLNLQKADGFAAVLDELSYGKVESACAEIDIARMVLFHELKFRFVSPIRGSKLNYDFEIFYPDGFKVCADAKCKFEATQLRASSIYGSLKDARSQLPDNEPSVVLVKVPEKWVSDIDLAKEIIREAEAYLRQSDHIMSIKFYAPITVIDDERATRAHVYKEISNPNFPDRDWDMFRDDMRSPVNGMPSWWIRIFPELRIPE